jgi:S-DNA-T family DNA segregation ATPase FtsK/SpoIIIE
VGRARDIDPGHARDGIALAMLGAAVIVIASSWFDAARPVGGWIDNFLRVLIGSAVLVLPVALIAIAVLLMRTEPDPDARPRLILGASMITLPVLGLWHLWAGSPEAPGARRDAGGFVGFAIGGPLADGLTPWIAAPLLFIGALFGLLPLTGITIREVPDAMRVKRDARDEHAWRRGALRGDEPRRVGAAIKNAEHVEGVGRDGFGVRRGRDRELRRGSEHGEDDGHSGGIL